MHDQFESLTADNEFVVLNNIVFNAKQIKNAIVQDYKPNKNDFSFCHKNLFLKKYFREINNQGIFNRIEWKYWLKTDTQCELITFDKVRQLDQLQIKVILDFYTNNELCNQKNCHTRKYFEVKISIHYRLQQQLVAEIPKIDHIQIIAFKDINEQNTAYFYTRSSQKICI